MPSPKKPSQYFILLSHRTTNLRYFLCSQEMPRSTFHRCFSRILIWGSDLYWPIRRWEIYGNSFMAKICNRNSSASYTQSELKSWSPRCVKAPGIVDRKSVHISNIDRFTIGDSRELSRVVATNF
jgi:hypothetical protein